MSRVSQIAQVLCRYLAAQGRRVPSSAVAEALGNAAPAERVAALLGRYGFVARVVTIDSARLRFLEGDALVLLADGQLALARKGWRWFSLEDHAGQRRRLSASKLDALLAGAAIQIESPGAGGSFRHVAFDVARASAPTLLVLLAASGLVSLAATTGPLATLLVLDRAVPDGNASLLLCAAVLILGVALHRAAFGLVRDAAARFLHLKSTERLLTRVFERVLRLPFAELARRTTSERTQIVRSAESLLNTVTESTLVPLLDVFVLLGFGGMLAWLLPGVALVIGAGCALALLAVQVAALRGASLKEQALQAHQREAQSLVDLIHGADTIKAAGAGAYQTARWRDTLCDARHLELRAAALGARTRTWTTLLYGRVFPLLVLFWSGYRALDGQLSLGTLVAALQATLGLGDAASRLHEVSLRLWGLRPDLRRVRAALALPEPAARAPGRVSAELSSELGGASFERSAPAPARGAAEAVRVDNLWFRYDRSASWTLCNVSLQVRRGTVHHLTGRSGSGKSTLLRLLAGLYPAEQGTIMLAGCAPEAARNLVVYLPQGAALVQGTLRDNLRLLSGGASEARITRAAAKTGLDELLESWPMGDGTLVGAGASTLSGGQRQLVLLTACVASTRPIVLLDEAFAHLDPIARGRLSLEALFLDEGRTVVSVTHEGSAQRRRPALAGVVTG